MASDSSAVLDLTDADATDADVTDVPREGEPAPLIMEHGYDIAVKVDAPMRQVSTLETYVTYRVRCVCARWPETTTVRRRYNHFKELRRRLSAARPLVAAPALPPLHSAREQLDRYARGFVAVRCLALHGFLDRVAKHPIFTHCDDFRLFLTTPDDEIDKVFKSESSALSLWGLSALYGNSETKTTNGARVKDPEFTSAAEYLQSLQQKLTALCSLTNKLYKGSATLATEYNNMRVSCDEWCSCERGGAGAGARGVGRGARGAGAARAPRPAPPPHGAVLPPLAAYCAAHRDKIRQRDALHAAYVSGNNSTDDLHNRLEQASEAIRSELTDWLPKTRSEIKELLLEIADRQVVIHTQTLMSWEQASKVASDRNIDEIFKTVSKTAVQNLSPSKCHADSTPTETERDFDDLDIENDSNDSDVLSMGRNEMNGIAEDVDEKNLEASEIESEIGGEVKQKDEIEETLEESQDSKVLDPLRSFSDVDLTS